MTYPTAISLLIRTFVVVLLCMILGACRGNHSSNDSASPDLGAAAASEVRISGTVADGYISGAVVCADINANETCDADDPSATTSSGGAYTLSLSSRDQSVEIIADIPATAIDEDNNRQIGQPLVFKTALNRPEFISPITTLVQQVRSNNPSLNIEDAEASVMSILGLDSETGVSLFDDYVAAADEQTMGTEGVNRYQLLRESARVITSVMKDFESQFDTAAQGTGIDITNDRIRGAIRDLVRMEVIALLPDIGQSVSQIVNVIETTAAQNTGNVSTSLQVDADQLALQLRPTDLADRIQERIHERILSSIERAELQPTSVQNLLEFGTYAIRMDCEHLAQSASDDISDGTIGLTLQEQAASDCTSSYRELKIDSASSELNANDYSWDPVSNTWKTDTQSQALLAEDFVLINGSWINADHINTQRQVEFSIDGEAFISSEFGTTILKGAEQNLQNLSLENHLQDINANPVWLEDSQDDVFPDGSKGFRLSLREATRPYVLFNYPDNTSNTTSATDCSEFAGNCNVVKTTDENGTHIVTSLDLLREHALSGAAIHNSEYASVNADVQTPVFTLTSEATNDGTFPLSGTAIWSVDFSASAAALINESTNLCTNIVIENTDVTQAATIAGVVEINSESQLLPKPDNSLIPPREPAALLTTGINFPAHNKCGKSVEATTQANEPADSDAEATADQSLANVISSSWTSTNVDGVSMIEVRMPIALRHDNSRDNVAALLLIEQDGVVRLGSRQRASDTKTVFTYNNVALEALQQKAIRILSAY